jgi:acyl carrier protein
MFPRGVYMLVIDQIRKIIVNELAVEESEVVEDAHLMDDLDADSMNLMVIFSEVEKISGTKIDGKISLNIKTVSDLVKIVEAKGE